MAYKFEDKYVHFRWNDELRDKKVFFADSIGRLEADVADSSSRRVLIGAHESGDCPFRVKAKQGESTTVWRFVYYDPNYDCKIAFNEGKQIQLKQPGTARWLDIDDPDWGDGTEYRIKPAKPCLKWADLKIGDVIRRENRTAMVTDVITANDANKHIYAGGQWFNDEYLSEWEKVEDDV